MVGRLHIVRFDDREPLSFVEIDAALRQFVSGRFYFQKQGFRGTCEQGTQHHLPIALVAKVLGNGKVLAVNDVREAPAVKHPDTTPCAVDAEETD